MPRLGESRLTGFSFKRYQASYRPLQPKKTRASHNLSPAWCINWAQREGGGVLNVGHMQMTNSSTLEGSCWHRPSSGVPGFQQLVGGDPSLQCVQTGRALREVFCHTLGPVEQPVN
jgi:hypothetical protein